MIDVYLINLNRRSDRLHEMRKQLDKKCNSWTLINAIDGQHLSSSFVNAVNKYSSRPLTRGEIGCVLSHIEAWKCAKNKGGNQSWILEDDVVINKSAEYSDSMIKRSGESEQWDIIYTSGSSNTEYFFDVCEEQHILPYLDKNNQRVFSINTDAIASRVGPQIGAYSYIVSSNGINKLLEFFDVIRNPVDVQIGQMNSWLPTYMFSTSIATHRHDGTSDTII